MARRSDTKAPAPEPEAVGFTICRIASIPMVCSSPFTGSSNAMGTGSRDQRCRRMPTPRPIPVRSSSIPSGAVHLDFTSRQQQQMTVPPRSCAGLRRSSPPQCPVIGRLCCKNTRRLWFVNTFSPIGPHIVLKSVLVPSNRVGCHRGNAEYSKRSEPVSWRIRSAQSRSTHSSPEGSGGTDNHDHKPAACRRGIASCLWWWL